MKRNLHNLRWLWLLLLCFSLGITAFGCGQTETADYDLTTMDTVEYTNSGNGATVTIPADWKKVREDENSTVFTNAEGSISFVIKWELGGMSYFSKEELAGLAADIGKSSLNNGTVYDSLELTKFDVAVKAICTGTVKDGSGNEVNGVNDTAIIQYYKDVRYYLTGVADAGTYAQYENVFTQIANSFKCSLTEDQVYEKLNAQNKAMAKAELEKDNEAQQ